MPHHLGSFRRAVFFMALVVALLASNVVSQTTTTTDASTTDATTTDATTTFPTATDTNTFPTVSTSTSATYSYPPPTVPPTNNAPYMQPTNLPEGTFFIVVGAILGAFGAAVLIWRAVIMCLLHRSVKRAALAQHMANDKAPFSAPTAPFYKYNDGESSLSLANASTGRGVRRTQRGPVPSATPSQTNLFFSPTAPGANTASNRESRFLPSGFYAAGSGSQQQGHGHSISLTNLRPDSHGHARAVGVTPPESPALQPRVDPTRRNVSTSSLNLANLTQSPAGGRAPSAYLEDLLADQPDQFPPQGGHNRI